jgi:rubrerythrin
MDDSISRQAAIDVVRKCNVKEVTPSYMLIDKAEAMTELMMLPSAQPRRGKWAGKGDSEGFGIFVCGTCGKVAMIKSDFCPNCGADMREEEQDATD